MQMWNPAHPGRLLHQIICGAVIDQAATNLQMDILELETFLDGGAPVTEELANRFGRLYPNQDAAFWMNLQKSYDEAKERRRAKYLTRKHKKR